MVDELRKEGEWRANKLTASEDDETVVGADVDGVHDAAPLGGGADSAAQEVAEALGLSVAADPRAAP